MSINTVENMQNTRPQATTGDFTDFSGERFYRIANHDAMPAFFMTIVSSSDVWNYLWSNGGITAGRIDCDHAVFPYYTADKVSDARNVTGPFTAIKVRTGTETRYWEPFSGNSDGIWHVERNLYKNTTGSKVYFEETNRELALTFQYGWTSSDKFGLVRHSRIINRSGNELDISILDGCRNILPACISAGFQNDNSVLLDAYKKTDLDAETGLAVFSVTSIVTDKAEPSEGLFANVGWFSCPGNLHLSPLTPQAFRYGESLPPETVLKGERPSFFIHRELKLSPASGSEGGNAEWYQVFDTSLDLARIRLLMKTIRGREKAQAELVEDIAEGVSLLEKYIADADGGQDTADLATCVHHKANVLFNIMRGGIFADKDRIDMADFVSFIRERNRSLVQPAEQAIKSASLGETAGYGELRVAVNNAGNAQLMRLFLEYLPLTFSRRHGDPSRPWNRFSIELKNADGSRKLNYQGNWRDIFQNWEALALSYPCFLENMTAKFLNAMTVDGFNPYRITRGGIDWEIQEPDNPWSNIGYWGDHQIIYLAKLLELESKFDRKNLLACLGKTLYSSGNVPYRLKSYRDIVHNPRSTIVFDMGLHDEIQKRAEAIGSDAKLVQDETGNPALVSMTAKLLTVILAKMANLVPGGGIWLNTQRPEWNDANNALAGWGLSVVTLCYLRRFMVFLESLYRDSPDRTFGVPLATAEFFDALSAHYKRHDPESLKDPLARRRFVDESGNLFEKQREETYKAGFAGGTVSISADDILSGLAAFTRHAEATIGQNRRGDGLYHSYNTLAIAEDGGMEIDYLNVMLEGQVAALSSLFLAPEEAVGLCRNLKSSALFRADQYSYILYPEKELPRFWDKNVADAKEARTIPLIASMLARGDASIAHLDCDGAFHFNPSFRNVRGLDAALEELQAQGRYSGTEIAADRGKIRDLYEKTFDHRSFTGRSGTFYAYEGLGSIYWHMVAKLMLAVQENCLAADNPATKKELSEIYYDVRKGIGFNKTPSAYGAFPTDPYSHTPAGAGAKQPGMTGQVKEEILTRWGELGITVERGIVSIEPYLLRDGEFREDGTLGFTWCGTPFVYRKTGKGGSREVTSIRITTEKGSQNRKGNTLTQEESQSLFARDGRILMMEVNIGTEI